jgi:tetrahydromethanopterin S-methyltransferase subunit A
VAIAAVARTGSAEIATAEEKIADALAQLEKIDAVKKLANGIQKNAAKIDGECTGISTSIHRLLDQALVALAGTGAAPTPAADVEPGAA